ncbi:MAG: hypothetical protein V1681_10500 [Candidatus Neomarinimicrobiota bacterium]
MLLLFMIPVILRPQSIVGEWDSYTSALTLLELSQIGNTIYAASPGGLVEFDKTSGHFNVFGPRDGLSNTDIQRLAPDSLGCIWLGMNAPNGVINVWNPSKNTIEMIFNDQQFGDEFTSIEAITFDSDLAFVAYQFNVKQGISYLKIDHDKYTYRDRYEHFPMTFSRINNLKVIRDTLWVATDVGLFCANLSAANLKDSSNWIRINMTGQDNVTGVIEYNNAVICSYGADIFQINGSTASKLGSGPGSSIAQIILDQSGNLMAVTTSGIFRYVDNTWQTLSQTAVNRILIDGDGIVWGGTNYKGLLKIDQGTEKLFIPNTILDNVNTSLYVGDDGKLVAASARGISFQTENGWYNIVKDYYTINISDHAQADWNYLVSDTIAYTLPDLNRIYTLLKREDEYYASLFGSFLAGLRGGGLLRFNPDDLNNYTVYDTTDGKLTASAGYGGGDNYLAVGYMTLDNNKNIWIANQFSQNDSCIAVLTPDNRWAHFSGTESGHYLNYLVTSIVFDPAGRVWFSSEPHTDSPVSNGGIAVLDYNNTLFDKSDDKWYWVTTSHGLASNSVFALAFDLENELWIMTAGGIQRATVSDNFPTNIFSEINSSQLSNISFAKECRIKVDGMNNKWISTINAGVKVFTYNGIWLNDVEGFTTDNSEILSNNILDIAFDTPEGLVYIATTKGISVYKSPFAYYGKKYKEPLAFPSPFIIPADNPVTIDGLLQNSEVKIMLLDGTLVRHLKASDGEVVGQQAFWDGRNEKGKLVSSGVYIFVAYTLDGDTITGKIAVVRR